MTYTLYIHYIYIIYYIYIKMLYITLRTLLKGDTTWRVQNKLKW